MRAAPLKAANDNEPRLERRYRGRSGQALLKKLQDETLIY